MEALKTQLIHESCSDPVILTNMLYNRWFQRTDGIIELMEEVSGDREFNHRSFELVAYKLIYQNTHEHVNDHFSLQPACR